MSMIKKGEGCDTGFRSRNKSYGSMVYYTTT